MYAARVRPERPERLVRKDAPCASGRTFFFLMLVTGDVQSFYTNVPIAETISLIKKIVIEEMAYEPWKVSLIEICLVAVMNYNCFQYGDEFDSQINGIAMGTSVAPVFANIYAVQLEQDLDEWQEIRLLSYVRDTDDIKFIFEGSLKQLSSFCVDSTFWEIESFLGYSFGLGRNPLFGLFLLLHFEARHYGTPIKAVP